MPKTTVCLYIPTKKLSGSGIGSAIKHQMEILKENKKIQVVNDIKLDYDILQLNTADFLSFNLARRAKLTGKRIIIYAHTTSEDFKNSFIFSNIFSIFVRAYLKKFYKHADLLICPSEYTKKLLEERYKIKCPMRVISNGVDIKRFDERELLEKRNVYRTRFNLKGTVVFCCAGVFERKGVSTFINVAKTLRNEAATFVWFGKIFPLSRITTLIRILTQRYVIFTNFVEDIQAAYAAGDVFLFPSKEENQGISVLEAIAAKRPVIVRDIQVFDWLEDGRDCLKASTDEEFAEKTKLLIHDVKLREKLVRNAFKKLISEGHDIDQAKRNYEKLYSNLLDNEK